ncbi:MAG: radical SAM protein [Candidatus Krumholzibacteria bacterium]|nr:radical SAM protein [Candidatus Krumholzibacteria bacterium]
MGRIFGPVPSRRLGRSLGVDVVPYKTCTFNCVYCECGATTRLTCDREEFYPLETLLDELRDSLAELRTPPDAITLSGAGEPTLYGRLGELIEEIGKLSSIPVAVITNSSLLFLPEVRADLSRADIVLPSLDAAVEIPFRRINRPHPSCTLERLTGGLGSFLDEYHGTVLLEILPVEGYNTDDDDLAALAAFVSSRRIDRIQLNTAVRPGTERAVGPLDAERLERIRHLFGPRCEIVAAAPARTCSEDPAAADRIVSLLERRPCTAEDIHRALGIPVPGVIKILETMTGSGRVVADEHDGVQFYTAAQRDRP